MNEPKQWDVFISHASEDKEAVALPLCKLLKEAGLRVWLDQEEIRLGESIPDRINQVLAKLTGVGLIIASPRYFEKAWTVKELNALLLLQINKKIKKIIPICHQIDENEISQWCPLLGDLRTISFDKKGLEQVALEILKAVDPEKYDEAHPIFLEQQRKALCRFLEEIEKEFNHARIFHLPHEIALQEQYIPIEVTLERRYRHKVEIVRGYTEGEKELSRAYAMKGFGEESEEEKEEIRRVQVPWQEARQQHKRLMVLADPGMGKTALLKMEALTTAQQARQWLESREKNGDEVILPIFLKLSDLAQKPDKEIVETILQQLQHRYQKTFEPIKALVRRKLEEGTCVLLLDALDETPSEQRLDLAEKLNIFARHYPCPMICTSRIVGYGSGFLGDAKEVEIVPFTRKQIEQYIEIWFNNLRSAEALLSPPKQSFCTPEGLIRELRQKPQIHGLAQNPLLLSLLCSLYQEDKLTLPARRVQIYEQAIQYMLYDWRRVSERRLTEKALTDAAWIEAKLELLESLAYQFSCEYKEIFSMRELLAKIESCKGDTALKHHNAPDIIKELAEEDGIIQQLDGEGRNTRYIFFHRTFQEYLTASYLKYHPNSIELAKTHIWDLDWHETLALFVGLQQDPLPFIKAIRKKKDDIFGSLLLLAGKCLSECEPCEHPVITDIIRRISAIWRIYPDVSFIKSVVFSLSQKFPPIFSALLETLQDENASTWSKHQAVEMLGYIRNSEAVPVLLEVLQNKEHWVNVGNDMLQRIGNSEWLRQKAVEALGRIGDPKAVIGLVNALNDTWFIASEAGRALRQIGDSRVVTDLLAILQYECSQIKAMVAEKLPDLSKERDDVGTYLWKIEISEKIDKNWQIRKIIIEALGHIRVKQAIPNLMEALDDVNKEVRLAVIKALRQIGDPQTILTMVGRLRNVEDHKIHEEALNALAAIRNPQAVPGLLEVVRNGNRGKVEAIKALGEIGDPQAVPDLLMALRKGDWSIQKAANEALSRIGDSQTVDGVVEMLNDRNEGARRRAIEMLGNIGDEQAVLTLSNTFQDNNENLSVRTAAACALEKIGNSRAIQALLSGLRDENERIRYAAEVFVARIADPQNLPAILKILRYGGDGRSEAATALGKIGDLETIPDLLRALRDEYYWVRKNAAEALKMIDSPQVLLGLLPMLQDKHDAAREAAAMVFLPERSYLPELLYEFDEGGGEIKIRGGVTQAVQEIRSNPLKFLPLLEILHDDHEEVRRAVIFVLSVINDEQTAQVLIKTLGDTSENVRIAAVCAVIMSQGERAVRPLIEMLHDNNEEVRRLTVHFLGTLHNSLTVSPLLQMLQDTDKEVRKEAVWVLGEIGDPQAIPGLHEMLRDETVEIRKTALEALGEIHDPNATKAILTALKDDEYTIRDTAIKLLKRKGSLDILAHLLNEPDIDVYDEEFFVVAHSLAIRFSQEKTPFIPVYPKLLKHKRREFRVRPDLRRSNLKKRLFP